MDCCLADLLHRRRPGGSGCGMPRAARRPLPLRRLLEIGADVAAGLMHLHPSIVHRDLKPANILLNASGVAKIADFGISRMKADSYLQTAHHEAGTVAYMAPECFSHGERE